ncbi:MAG: hypothetical protein B7Y39_01190 [Bdellovibrio sp. 28-41-41]|nr:MAG: hypothetical protein B7Y39_01190 [Bdellovibrio sp. 28-41-41]
MSYKVFNCDNKQMWHLSKIFITITLFLFITIIFLIGGVGALYNKIAILIKILDGPTFYLMFLSSIGIAYTFFDIIKKLIKYIQSRPKRESTKKSIEVLSALKILSDKLDNCFSLFIIFYFLFFAVLKICTQPFIDFAKQEVRICSLERSVTQSIPESEKVIAEKKLEKLRCETLEKNFKDALGFNK